MPDSPAPSESDEPDEVDLLFRDVDEMRQQAKFSKALVTVGQDLSEHRKHPRYAELRQLETKLRNEKRQHTELRHAIGELSADDAQAAGVAAKELKDAGDVGHTVAVKVTGSPKREGLLDVVREVTVS